MRINNIDKAIERARSIETCGTFNEWDSEDPDDIECADEFYAMTEEEIEEEKNRRIEKYGSLDNYYKEIEKKHTNTGNNTEGIPF